MQLTKDYLRNTRDKISLAVQVSPEWKNMTRNSSIAAFIEIWSGKLLL